VQCGFVGESGQRAMITGTTGRVDVHRPFYRTEAYTLTNAQGVEDVQLPVRGRGYVYEAEEVMRCLREGLTESPLIPHAATLEVMHTMDTVRAQIDVSYPDSLA